MRSENNILQSGIPVQTSVKAGKRCKGKDLNGCENWYYRRERDGIDPKENYNLHQACINSC
jgi:hypothetical protein